jgi:hypothetical protein
MADFSRLFTSMIRATYYLRNEFRARWVEFDRFFGLKGNGSRVDIGSSVQKHLLHMNSMLTPETRNYGSALPTGLALRYVSVFFFRTWRPARME